MTPPIVIVTGTGTGVGKTLVAAGLVAEWGRRLPVAGIKPIESGGDEDGRRLGQASTFHVTRFTSPYLLADPVSPHLAARREGRSIDLGMVLGWVEGVRQEAPAVVLELAGGLFTPLTLAHSNIDIASALTPRHVILVAPDRLGVLHDVLATKRAAEAAGVSIDQIVVSAPAEPDPTTGTNGPELQALLRMSAIFTLPRLGSVAGADVFARLLAPLRG